MTNIEHIERMLKEYNALNCRIKYLEKLQEKKLATLSSSV